MSGGLMNSVASRWARLGVMLNVKPAAATPDVERLLLDTARVAGANTRLFVLAGTWLVRYGDYVARHRLARLVREELEPEHRLTLGFLLSWARDNGPANASRFNLAISACESGGAADAFPLADVERQNPRLRRLAERRASALSLRWGRWMTEFGPKDDALRPEEWVAAHNPALRERALTGGDLVASVLIECQARPGPVESESELARRCGASRTAVREAVRRLRLAGRLKTVENGRANAVQIV